MRTNQGIPPPAHVDPQWKIGIVHTLYHAADIAPLRQSAKDALIAAGISEHHIFEYAAPGAFEVPLIGAALAKKGGIDALIGLGIIVQGDTFHADHLAREVTRGMMDVQTTLQIPFAYEILHVRTLADAQARANKGEEAALAVLHSLAELRRIRS
jgi:6,7-dimethyl-8-ribityllumazine synthase